MSDSVAAHRARHSFCEDVIAYLNEVADQADELSDHIAAVVIRGAVRDGRSFEEVATDHGLKLDLVVSTMERLIVIWREVFAELRARDAIPA